MTRIRCSLSLDLDNQWSYMKTHGDVGWENFPSYLGTVVPRVLDILHTRQLEITFFVVGQDAVLDQNRDALAGIPAAGHEVGNHSFRHEPWLHLYAASEIEDEIIRAEDAIGTATGVRPRGFRGPGYSLSPATLEVLARRGYQYDASTFPTFLGPLARAYYFLTTRLDTDERSKRQQLFGTVRDGLQPLRPYWWDLGDRSLLEIPVSTMPVLKVPFHFSYLLYLATVSEGLARLHLRLALWMCRATSIEPSLLLHPLDFLGGNDVSELSFFPAMSLLSERKLGLITGLLDLVMRRAEVMAMHVHADRAARDPGLSRRQPIRLSGDVVSARRGPPQRSA